jgi:hypothetical protein
MVVVAGEAAERQGRLQPEPGRLYAALQANSVAVGETGVAVSSAHAAGGRAGVGGGGGGGVVGRVVVVVMMYWWRRVRTDGWL